MYLISSDSFLFVIRKFFKHFSYKLNIQNDYILNNDIIKERKKKEIYIDINKLSNE